MRTPEEFDHYELLEVPRDAGAEEIERAYAMVRAAYAEGALASYSVFDPAEAAALRERIDQAFRVLSDPEQRRAYDATLGAPEPLPVEEPEAELATLASLESVAPAASAPPVQAELEGLGDLGEEEPDAPWDGARLRRARLLRGVDHEAVAQTTKVNPTYLRFIEEENFSDLPATVYVRGFVGAYARFLGLDAAAVTSSYMERYEGGGGDPRGRSRRLRRR